MKNKCLFVKSYDPKKINFTVPENIAVMNAYCGNVIIELYPNISPKSVERFKMLIKSGEYNDTAFHRVIKDVLVQAGDLEFGDSHPEKMPNQTTCTSNLALIFGNFEVFVHISLFDDIRKGVYVDVVKNATKALNHKYAPAWRKYLLGSNIRERGVIKYPNLLDTVELTKDPSKEIKLKNSLYMDSSSKKIYEKTQVESIKIIDKNTFWVTSEAETFGSPYLFKISL